MSTMPVAVRSTRPTAYGYDLCWPGGDLSLAALFRSRPIQERQGEWGKGEEQGEGGRRGTGARGAEPGHARPWPRPIQQSD